MSVCVFPKYLQLYRDSACCTCGAMETNKSLFHKRFMCFQYLSKYLFQSSKCTPSHRKFPLFKGTGFYNFFLVAREITLSAS